MAAVDQLEIVADSLRRVRTGLAYFAGGCWLAAAIALGVGVAQQKVTPIVVGLGGASAATGLLASGFLLRYLRIEAVPIYRVLRDTPEDIVWFYGNNTQNRVDGIRVSTEYWVAVHLKNGKSLQLRSIRPEAMQPILDVIRERAPQAVFGYSEAIAQQYLQDPNSLID